MDRVGRWIAPALVCGLALAGSSRPARAQSVQVGATVGATFNEINVDGREALNVVFTARRAGAAGVALLFPLSESFQLETDGLLTTKGSTFDDGQRGLRIRLRYLEVPLLVRYVGAASRGVQVHVFGGPYVGYLLKARVREVGVPGSVDALASFNRLDVGWVAGLGVGLGRVRFDVRYGGGFSDLAALENLGGLVVTAPANPPLRYRNRGFSFLGTYFF